MSKQLITSLNDVELLILLDKIVSATDKATMKRDEEVKDYIKFAPPEVLTFLEGVDYTKCISISASHPIGKFKDERVNKIYEYCLDIEGSSFDEVGIVRWLSSAPDRLICSIDRVIPIYEDFDYEEVADNITMNGDYEEAADNITMNDDLGSNLKDFNDDYEEVADNITMENDLGSNSENYWMDDENEDNYNDECWNDENEDNYNNEGVLDYEEYLNEVINDFDSFNDNEDFDSFNDNEGFDSFNDNEDFKGDNPFSNRYHQLGVATKAEFHNSVIQLNNAISEFIRVYDLADMNKEIKLEAANILLDKLNGAVIQRRKTIELDRYLSKLNM